MEIKQKVRIYSENLAVTIPYQITEFHDIKVDDYMELTSIGSVEFKSKKAWQLRFQIRMQIAIIEKKD